MKSKKTTDRYCRKLSKISNLKTKTHLEKSSFLTDLDIKVLFNMKNALKRHKNVSLIIRLVMRVNVICFTVPVNEGLDELASVELVVAVSVVHLEVVELQLLLRHVRRVDGDVHVLFHVPGNKLLLIIIPIVVGQKQ